jgi:hypothetical protein
VTALLLAWLTAMALIALLACVHSWTPERFPAATRQAATWCTTLAALAAALDLMRHP